MTDYHNEQSTALATVENRQVSVFSTGQHFEQAQRVAKMLAQSDLVPKEYQGSISNCMIAMEIAQRTGTGAFEVTQNLEVIHGRPSWKSSYVIAKLNSCGRFSPLEFEFEDRGEKTVEYEYTKWEGKRKSRETAKQKVRDKACRVVTKSLATNNIQHGPWVSIEMAVKEGWYNRSGSKWQTMPDIMLQYRAASFFGRMSAPEVLLGMHSADEVVDIGEVEILPDEPRPAELSGSSKIADLNDQIDDDQPKETKAEKQPEPEETKKEPEPETTTQPAVPSFTKEDVENGKGAELKAYVEELQEKGLELDLGSKPKVGDVREKLLALFADEGPLEDESLDDPDDEEEDDWDDDDEL